MRTPDDESLPATLAFVFSLGALIVVGWCATYVLPSRIHPERQS